MEWSVIGDFVVLFARDSDSVFDSKTAWLSFSMQLRGHAPSPISSFHDFQK